MQQTSLFGFQTDASKLMLKGGISIPIQYGVKYKQNHLRPLRNPIRVWAMMVTLAVISAQEVTLRDKTSPSVSCIHPLRQKAWTSRFLLCKTASVSSGLLMNVKISLRWSTTIPMSCTAHVSDLEVGKKPPLLAVAEKSIFFFHRKAERA